MTVVTQSILDLSLRANTLVAGEFRGLVRYGVGHWEHLARFVRSAAHELELNRVELKPRSWGREKSMTRFAYSLLTAGLLAALGAAPASAESDFARKTHAVITIDKDGVHPTQLRIKPDEVVGWLNYSDATAQIVFPKKVADAFKCSNVRPSFYRIAGGRLISRPIGALEFVQPCQIAPGTYHYGVVLTYGVGGTFDTGNILEFLVPAEGDLPEFDLQGEIQVK